MNLNQALSSLAGGALIGLAVTIMLLFNGRVTGISGILSTSLSKPTSESLWRWLFVAGLILGGTIVYNLKPEYFVNTSDRSLQVILLAGLLVGYGTVMAGGCTSGHGICGLSRLSVRSLVAVLTFMSFGFLAVQLMKAIGGSL
jgi:uncharacterized membrane protein YedE/YeeE